MARQPSQKPKTSGGRAHLVGFSAASYPGALYRSRKIEQQQDNTGQVLHRDDMCSKAAKWASGRSSLRA